MSVCSLNQDYLLARIQGGQLELERQIALSPDAKRILIETLNPSRTTECEYVIDKSEIGIDVSSGNNLQLTNPAPNCNISVTYRVKVVANTSPTIQLLIEGSDIILSFIGIEDMRIGRADTKCKFNIKSGCNLEHTLINGQEYIILKLWQK